MFKNGLRAGLVLSAALVVMAVLPASAQDRDMGRHMHHRMMRHEMRHERHRMMRHEMRRHMRHRMMRHEMHHG